MKKIPTKKGEIIFVDDKDYNYLSQYKWRVVNGYAVRSVYFPKTKKSLNMRMHREILDLGFGKRGRNNTVVDHIDKNKLNNTRANLRVCTKQENEWNRYAYANNTSGYPGVSHKKDCPENPYQARITVDGQLKCLGNFPTPEKAYIAYLEAKIFYHISNTSRSLQSPPIPPHRRADGVSRSFL